VALLPDTDVLDGLARHISGHADEMRRRAVRLAAAVEAVHWRSTAAEAFRNRARDLVADLRRAAAGIDDAAESLRHHAANVRHAESVAGGVGHAVVAAAEAIL
jgi:uncharacterized protein YukE